MVSGLGSDLFRILQRERLLRVCSEVLLKPTIAWLPLIAGPLVYMEEAIGM